MTEPHPAPRPPLGLIRLGGWLRGYTRHDGLADLAAGLTVGVLLVPQGMAYAVLAGLPAIYGLYASLVPLCVAALFTSARSVAFGVVAIDMLIVGSAIGHLGAQTPEEAAQLAVALAAMAGLGHLALGLLRLGWVVAYLSRPVVAGFMIAAPLLIGASQVGALLGVPWPRLGDLSALAEVNWAAVGHPVPAAMAVGGGSIVVLLALRRWAPRVPSALVVIIGATAAIWAGGLGGTIAQVGAVPSSLPPPSLPLFDLATIRSLLGTALPLILIQLMTVVTLGRTLGDSDDRVDPDQELVTLGVANLAGSLFHSPPVSASLSRSALTAHSGGRTPLTNVVAACVVALSLGFLAPALARVPVSALAAVIVVSALRLVDLAELRALFAIRRREALLAALTAGLTLLLGVQEGVVIGVAVSLLAMLAQTSRPRVVELGRMADGSGYRDLRADGGAGQIPGALILRVDGSLNFANAEYVADQIVERVDGLDRPIAALILDGRGINGVDATSIEALAGLAHRLDERGVALHLGHFKSAPRAVVERAGLMELVHNDDPGAFPEALVQALPLSLDPLPAASSGSGSGPDPSAPGR